MGSMGAELFEMSWVQGIVQFFNYLAWTLYVIGLIVACFECGINYAGGKGDIRAVALNAIKGSWRRACFPSYRSDCTSSRSPCRPSLLQA